MKLLGSLRHELFSLLTCLHTTNTRFDGCSGRQPRSCANKRGACLPLSSGRLVFWTSREIVFYYDTKLPFTICDLQVLSLDCVFLRIRGGGAMVSWLVCSTPDGVVRARVLAGDIVLCSWARHLTLMVPVPLSTQVYKWVPVNLMLGVTLRWIGIPSREE